MGMSGDLRKQVIYCFTREVGSRSNGSYIAFWRRSRRTLLSSLVMLERGATTERKTLEVSNLTISVTSFGSWLIEGSSDVLGGLTRN